MSTGALQSISLRDGVLIDNCDEAELYYEGVSGVARYRVPLICIALSALGSVIFTYPSGLMVLSPIKDWFMLVCFIAFIEDSRLLE